MSELLCDCGTPENIHPRFVCSGESDPRLFTPLNTARAILVMERLRELAAQPQVFSDAELAEAETFVAGLRRQFGAQMQAYDVAVMIRACRQPPDKRDGGD
jgi:hypothetical protein